MNKGYLSIEETEDNTFLTNETALTLDSLCTIQRRVRVVNGIGGFTETYTNRATGVHCAVNVHKQGIEGETGGQLGGETAYVIHLPPGQTVTVSDLIVVVGGDTHEVTDIETPVSIEVCRTVYTVVQKSG